MLKRANARYDVSATRFNRASVSISGVGAHAASAAGSAAQSASRPTATDHSAAGHGENKIEGSGEAFGEALKANSALKGLHMDECSLGPEDGKSRPGGRAGGQHDAGDGACWCCRVRACVRGG